MRTIGTPSTQVRKLNAIASGALPNGDPVVVNADGTVSVVAETAVSQSVGSPTVFESASIGYTSSTFDSSNNKVIVSYRDIGNSGYGTAVVGTVSGTSISFGTPVVFTSASTAYTGSTFDTSNNKVVIAYSADNAARAVVGTVSGTSISFGGVVDIGTTGGWITATFDSSSNKVVVAFNNSGGYATVGTVSGTTISFGTLVNYESGRSDYNTVVFDASNNKVVVSYADDADSAKGKSVVGTVSGTSISFGTPVQFESGRTETISSAYDSNAGKVVIAYKDNGNSSYGTSIVGTVSGTSISFGAAVVFQSISSESFSATFDASNNTVVIAYREGSSGKGYVIAGSVSGTSISFTTRVLYNDNGTDSIAIAYDSASSKSIISYRTYSNYYGTSIVYTGAGTATNLTSENYIGLASNGYPDTAGATIDVQGAINDRQSGLTAGQAYYVQTDGTLTTTAGDPSVFAGTAISATKMIVKG